MTAINFPQDPGAQTPVNTFSPDSTPEANTTNSVTFLWDGVKWTAGGSGGGGGAPLWQRDDGTSTLSPVTADDNIDQGAGDITTTGDVSAAAGTFTGDVSAANFTTTGDVQTTSLNGGPLAGLRNQLINGDFRIWQRGTNVTGQISASTGTYLSTDRWAFFNAGGIQNIRVARNGNPITEAPSAYSMQLDSATVALDQARLIQGIELTRTGFVDQFRVGTTWTLSVYSDTDLTSRTPGYGFADDTIRANNVGGGGIESWQPLGGNRYKSTFTIDVTPVSTNAIFYIIDAPPVGSTLVNYTCWQLEPGPVATPVEMRPIGLELQLCQRYFISTQGSYFEFNTAQSAGGAYMVYFPTQMRISNADIVFNNGLNIGTVDASPGHFFFNTNGNVRPSFSYYTADAEL